MLKNSPRVDDEKTILTRTEVDYSLRHSLSNARADRVAALAARGDDERIPRRRHGGRLAGGDCEPHLLFTQPRIIAVSLRDGSKVVMNNSSQTVARSGSAFQLLLATGAF